MAVGLAVAVAVAYWAYCAVAAVAGAVGGDSGGGLGGGGGSVIEVVVSSSMFSFVGRVPSAVVEGCVRSICVSGRPLPSVNPPATASLR